MGKRPSAGTSERSFMHVPFRDDGANMQCIPIRVVSVHSNAHNMLEVTNTD